MTSSTSTFSDHFLAPLDRARTAVFVRALELRLVRPVLLRKERRVPALLLVHAAGALVLAVLWPTLLLVVGPLVLGVPHVLADLRYLVLRPALPRLVRPLLLSGAAALLLLRGLETLGLLRDVVRLELGLAALLTLAVVVLAAPSRRSARAVVAVVVTLTLAGVALARPQAARLVLVHAHNLIALLLWALVFCRTRGRALGVVAVIVGAASLLLVTPLAWWGFRQGVPASLGLHSFAAADSLAPGVASAPLALGLMASFAFLQSVHYAVWLHAIPQEATRGDATLSFRMSYRSLKSELGGPLLWAAVLLVVAVPLAGCVAPLRTQATYLGLSSFHAYLELAVLALWWLRGRDGVRC